MDELFRRAVIALRGMWQYRWLGLAVAWVTGTIGATAILLMHDKYEASARIFVNTDSILKPLMTGMTVQPNIDQQIGLLSRTLLSRPNVERLVHLGGLDAEAKSKSEVDAIVDSTTKAIVIRGAGRDNLYTLTYRDEQPMQAKRIVELLASIFVESGQGDRIGDTGAAKQFIEEQIATYDKKLQEAENRLKEFKLANLGVEPGQGRDYFARMSEASTALSQAQLQLREAENSRDVFARQLAAADGGVDAESGNSGGAVVPEIDSRIEALKRNLDALLQRFTEAHPDVIGTRRVIKELEEQKRQELLARKANPGASLAGSHSAVFDKLKVSLAEAEASVASLRARVAEYSGRYNHLKESVQSIPRLEAEFAQLNRDYEVNKKAYENLVSRRESASISGQMQAVAGVADFRLVDPPRVAHTPVAPSRVMLLPLMLLAALAAGAAASYAASEMRPTFFDMRTLRDATGLPVLGTVSALADDSKQSAERRGVIWFGTGLAGLLGSYLLGVVILAFMYVRAV